MRKYILSAKPTRKILNVEENVHILIKSYAEEKGITIAEATYVLIGKGLAQEEGVKLEE